VWKCLYTNQNKYNNNNNNDDECVTHLDPETTLFTYPYHSLSTDQTLYALVCMFSIVTLEILIKLIAGTTVEIIFNYNLFFPWHMVIILISRIVLALNLRVLEQIITFPLNSWYSRITLKSPMHFKVTEVNVR